MPILQDEVMRIAVRQRAEDGQDIVNVYEVQAGADSADSNQTMLEAIRDHYDSAYSNLNSNFPEDQTPVDIKVDIIELVGGIKRIVRNIGTISWGSLFNPGGTSDNIPAGVAAVVLFRTIVGKVFGRKFLGQLMEGNVSGDSYSGTITAAIALYIADILSTFAFTGATCSPGVLSTREGSFLFFQEGELSQFPGYQRRRRPGTGS